MVVVVVLGREEEGSGMMGIRCLGWDREGTKIVEEIRIRTDSYAGMRWCS